MTGTRTRRRPPTPLLLCLALLLPACAPQPETPASIDYAALTDRIADGMVGGVRLDSVEITADRYDASTGRVLGVRVNSSEGAMAAAWADFATDRVNGSIRIILHDVTLASAGSADAPGAVSRREVVALEPIPVTDLLASR